MTIRDQIKAVRLVRLRRELGLPSSATLAEIAAAVAALSRPDHRADMTRRLRAAS